MSGVCVLQVSRNFASKDRTLGSPCDRGKESESDRLQLEWPGRREDRSGGADGWLDGRTDGGGRNDIGPSIADQRDAEGGKGRERGFRLDPCADNKRHHRKQGAQGITACWREGWREGGNVEGTNSFFSGIEFRPEGSIHSAAVIDDYD